MLARALPLLLLVACGGKDEDRPERPSGDVQQAADECELAEQRADDGWEFENIADFERPADGTRSKWQAQCLPPFACGFYFNYDEALTPTERSSCAEALGVSTSKIPTGVPFASPLPEARCDSSETAYHFASRHVAICLDDEGRPGWGATLGITFNPSAAQGNVADPTIDRSDWDGVSFWVRRGAEPSLTSMLASTRDLASAPQDQICSADAGAPDAVKCDPFGNGVLLTEEWKFYALPFSQLKQKGFGVPSAAGQLGTNAIVGLEFGWSAGDWDVWLDDLAFYREPR